MAAATREVNEEREKRDRRKSGCLFCENPTPEKRTGWFEGVLAGKAAVELNSKQGIGRLSQLEMNQKYQILNQYCATNQGKSDLGYSVIFRLVLIFSLLSLL